MINIGSGCAQQVRAVAHNLARAAGFDGDFVESLPGPARSHGVTWTQADIRLADSSLGWAPRRLLATTVQDVWHAVAPSSVGEQGRRR